MSPEMCELIMYQKRPDEGVQLVSVVAEGTVQKMVSVRDSAIYKG